MLTVDSGPFYLPDDAVQTWLEYVMNAACPAAPAQLPLTLRLFSNDVDLDCGTVLADLTESDFDGYVGIPLTDGTDCDTFLQGPQQLPDGTWAIFLDQQEFVMAGTTTPETVFGAYITGGADDILFAVKKFAVPAAMATDGPPADTVKVSGPISLLCSVPLPEDLP